MKKIIFTSFLLLLINLCYSQKINETKEFIELKINSLAFEFKDYGNNSDFKLEWDYKFKFYKDYLTISQSIFTNNKLTNVKTNAFLIKSIKSFKFNIVNERISTLNIELMNNESPLCFENTPITILDSVNILKQLKCRKALQFDYKIKNKETEDKISKAITHLVSLYGGKVIDDLF